MHLKKSTLALIGACLLILLLMAGPVILPQLSHNWLFRCFGIGCFAGLVGYYARHSR